MNTRNTRRQVLPDPSQIGDDIDLDVEEHTDAGGNRITESSTDEYTNGRAETARHGGRPSLGSKGSSPQIAFRIPADLRDKATAIAEQEGRTISAIAREQLERYIAEHAA